MREQFIELKMPWISPDEPVVEMVRWLVEPGQSVEIDEDLAIMLVDGDEFILPAPVDGMIDDFNVLSGEYVSSGQVMAIIKII